MRITEDRKGRLLETLWELNDRFNAGDDEALGHMFAAITQFAEEAALDERGRILTWQPIKTAPKDGTHIMLCIPDWDYEQTPKAPTRVMVEGWWDEEMYPSGEWRVITLPSHGCDCCAFENQEPTHWMPLPEMP